MEKVSAEYVVNYAKANFMTIEEAAEKLKEQGKVLSDDEANKLAEIGGKPDAPIDGFNGKTYTGTLNGEEFTLTSKDKDGFSDGNLSLTEKAKEFLSRFGIKSTFVEDGKLMARHQDGNVYEVAQVEERADNVASNGVTVQDFAQAYEKLTPEKEAQLKDIDKQLKVAVEEGNKDLIAQLLAKAADTLDLPHAAIPEDFDPTSTMAALPLLASRTPVVGKFVMASAALGMLLSLSACSTPEGDFTGQAQGVWYTQNQEAIIAAINALGEKITSNANQNADKIINAIVGAINNQTSSLTQAVNDAVVALKAALGLSTEELISFLTQNNNTLAEIRDLLEDQGKTQDEMAKELTKIRILLTQINNNGRTTNKILAAIQEALKKLPGELKLQFEQYFVDILEELAKGNEKADSLEQLLIEINNNIKKYGDENGAVLRSILAELQKMDYALASGINAILAAINSGKKIDLSAIEAMLRELNNKANKNNEQNETIIKQNNLILEAIAKLGNDAKAYLEAILGEIMNQPDYSAKLDKLIALVAKMDENNQAMGNKILAAIKKLGGDMIAKFDAVLAKIEQVGKDSAKGKDYTNVLNAILAKLTNIEGENKYQSASLKAILDALGQFKPEKIDLSKILAKLDEILKAIKDHHVIIHITVDKDGTPEVHCEDENGNPVDVHEGVLSEEELKDIFG